MASSWGRLGPAASAQPCEETGRTSAITRRPTFKQSTAEFGTFFSFPPYLLTHVGDWIVNKWDVRAGNLESV